jgi:D-lactate dehydrogenase
VIWRDIQAKKRAGIDTRELETIYRYQGIDTCAATGLCAQRCPVGINTGDLVRKLRGHEANHPKQAAWLADNFTRSLQGTRLLLSTVNTARKLLGPTRLSKVSTTLHNLSQGRVPQWTPAMPQAVTPLQVIPPTEDSRPRVVYLPACVSRSMGPAFTDTEQMSLLDKTRALLEKGGFQVVFPDSVDALCCGQPFASKGYLEQADRKRQELLDALLKASRGGLDPIYCDTSPCSLRLLEGTQDTRLNLYDPVRFIREHLLERLDIHPQQQSVAVHVTCSTHHLGEAQGLIDIARCCAVDVVIPEGIHCCGFAGDKGFTQPELNSHALRSLKSAVQHCSEGISTSRTCEIGLSQHGGIDYHGLVYLLDRVSSSKTTAPAL